jgi:hypothetical protein
VARTWVFDERHAAYPGVAQGGLVCGTVASLLDASAARVTLRQPPHVGEILVGERNGDVATLRLRSARVAEAHPVTDVPAAVPAPVSMPEALAAARRFPAMPHPTPRCFCCGHLREPHEALRILSGPVQDRPMAAAPWVPRPEFGVDGTVETRYVWAALDCPGFWGAAYAVNVRPSVTVRMSADVLAPIAVGTPYVVTGWLIGRRSRKTICGSAIFTEGGELVALARADWMETRAAAASVSEWGANHRG